MTEAGWPLRHATSRGAEGGRSGRQQNLVRSGILANFRRWTWLVRFDELETVRSFLNQELHVVEKKPRWSPWNEDHRGAISTTWSSWLRNDLTVWIIDQNLPSRYNCHWEDFRSKFQILVRYFLIFCRIPAVEIHLLVLARMSFQRLPRKRVLVRRRTSFSAKKKGPRINPKSRNSESLYRMGHNGSLSSLRSARVVK